MKRSQIGHDCPERWLFVFGCVRKGCGKEGRCWKCFRIQFDSATRPKTEIASTEQAPAPSFLQELAEETKPATGEVSFSLEGLREALESAPKKKSKKPSKKRRTSLNSNPVGGVKIERDVLLPGFHIYAEWEPPVEENIKDGCADLRVQSSLERYERVMTRGNEDAPWQNETYEKADYEAVDDGAFWRFQQRIQACPQQCVRYGFHASLLNPTNIVPTPSCCPACGSIRVYEMQLMPHFIGALYEAAAWFQSDSGSMERVDIQKAVRSGYVCSLEWDWSSIALYSCAQSCGTTRVTCVEESVFLL